MASPPAIPAQPNSVANTIDDDQQEVYYVPFFITGFLIGGFFGGFYGGVFGYVCLAIYLGLWMISFFMQLQEDWEANI